MEKDIVEDVPEITPVGSQRMLGIGFQIGSFIGLNGIDVVGIDVVGVEWRQQSGFVLDAQLLHLGAVFFEKTVGQGTNANQFDVAAQEVVDHRPFVYPVSSQPATDIDYAVVVQNLPRFRQMMVGMQFLLQKLTVGMHGPHLVDMDDFAVLSDARQCDDGAQMGRFCNGLANARGAKDKCAVAETLRLCLEASVTQPP